MGDYRSIEKAILGLTRRTAIFQDRDAEAGKTKRMKK
jgi:hypothetical protein